MPAAADAPFRLRCDHLDDPVGHPEARPRLSWLLPPSLVRQRAYEVATDDGQGTNRVESERAYLVDWPFEPLRSRQRVTWRVRAWGEGDAPTAWSEWAIVEAGLLQRSDWQGAFIGGALVGGPRTSPPTTLLRRTFAAPAGVERARLHIAALGLFVARLNGERVGDAHLAPGWTEYAKRVQAQTLEVDHLLRAGDNELVIELADSWYAGHVGWQHRQTYGERPWLLAQVEADGRVLAATDEAWQAAQDGPTLRADLLMGEEHDARRIPTDWRPAVACEGGRFDALAIAGSASAPVREQEVLEPREAHHLGDHFARQTWRLDFGQNLVGVPRLNFAALKDVLPPGADDFPGGVTLKLRFAEMLRDDGTLYVENLRSAEATDYYTSRGDEVSAGVAWQPQFTFHGFRYLELSGLPPLRDGAAPPTGFATAVVLHNEMEPTGRFECSDPRVNALQHCIRWGQKGNFMSIPTDCPQRDERLGWTGDIQVFAPTACFNRDVAGFLDKWLLDLRDAQSAEGAVPAVCPSVAMSGANPWHSDSADEPVQDGGPAWSDAAVVVPYAHFRSYADTRAIERMHEAMCRYVAFLRDRDSHGLIRRHALHAAWGGFGDWLALDGGSPGTGGRDGGTAKDLIGTAYFARCCALLAEMSDAIGRDAAEWRQLGDDVAAAFRREFATEGGRLASHTQTAYLLGARVRPARRGAASWGGRVPARPAQAARLEAGDGLRRHALAAADAHAVRPRGQGVPGAAERHVSRLALHGLPRRDDDVGALEQLDADRRLRACRDELVQPLRLRRGRAVAVRDGGRPVAGRAGLPRQPHRAAAGQSGVRRGVDVGGDEPAHAARAASRRRGGLRAARSPFAQSSRRTRSPAFGCPAAPSTTPVPASTRGARRSPTRPHRRGVDPRGAAGRGCRSAAAPAWRARASAPCPAAWRPPPSRG